MEKNKYVLVLLQGLKKKDKILDNILAVNEKQKQELENPELSVEDFDKTMDEKQKLIDQLNTIDDGFQEVFERVKEELANNKAFYKEEIAQMQDYIRKLTEKSADIQVGEARNKDLMEKKFSSVKKQVKEIRKSQKVVNQYYRNMMKMNYIDSQFTDNRK